MDDEKTTKSQVFLWKAGVFIYTVLKLFFPQIFYLQEDIMEILYAMDAHLIPFAMVVWVFGYWFKRNGLPKWAPPLPLVLFLLSFVLCACYGWAHTTATGAKSLMIILVEYGLCNGALITFMSTFGYDIVHGYTKKRNEGIEVDPLMADLKWIGDQTVTVAVTLKKLVYPIAAGASAVLTFGVFFIFAHAGVFYSLCWAIFAASMAVTIARAVLHIVKKDYSAEMFQVTIYMLLACAGWLGAILADTWGFTTVSLAIMLCAIMMAVGTRFIRGRALLLKLKSTLVYKPMGDVIGGEPDTDRPLILKEDGTAVTLAEAEKLGLDKDEIAEGISYLKEIIVNTKNKE